jgi:hypothetical protein
MLVIAGGIILGCIGLNLLRALFTPRVDPELIRQAIIAEQRQRDLQFANELRRAESRGRVEEEAEWRLLALRAHDRATRHK